MKSLNCIQLKGLAKELNETLRGNHISNISLINETDILFTFSFYRKAKLLISLNHNAPFMFLIENELALPTITNRLLEELRRNIKNVVIKSISTVNDDRVVLMQLEKTDEFYVKTQLFLYLELIPRHPNIVLTDTDNKIIFASFYTGVDANRVIVKGFKYEQIEKQNSLNEFDEDYSYFKNEVDEYIPLATSNRIKNKYHALYELLTRRYKVSQKKIEILNKEISDANNLLAYKDHANMLLTYQYDKDELTSYINENKVPYDHDLSVVENANKLFKIYKKAKTTVSTDLEQLKINEENIKKLEDDLATFNNYEEGSIMLLANLYLKAPIPKEEVNKLAPYYIEINNTKIAYGKNATQNDFLTFKYASKENYFFHVKDRHGSHVVILKNKPNNIDMANASELALALSNLEAGEVNAAIIKNIKRGNVPGLVLLNEYQTYKINNVKEEIKYKIKSDYKRLKSFNK